MGFSIVPHLWLPEKVFTDCVKCPLFRPCGSTRWSCRSTSAFDAEHGYGMPAAAPARMPRDGCLVPDHQRRRHHAARLPRRRRQRRHQGQAGSLDLALLVSDAASGDCRRLHHQQSAVAAPVVVSREHLARSAAWRAPSSSTAAAPTPAPGDDGLQVAREMAAETARLVGCPVEQVLVASTGVIGVALPIGEDPRADCRSRCERSARIRVPPRLAPS